MEIAEFYKGKRVLVTGHTGFKGTWMCHVLADMGADVTGYALKPPTSPSLFECSEAEKRIKSVEGDVRDLPHLKSVFEDVSPEIVIHMAAQPIVRESYKNPVYTYDVNVMGTVNVLECVRQSDSVKSVVNVTTDKVYRNREWLWGYREEEELNGFDPYSNSKSCSELVTESYRKSFLVDKKIAVSTARAGNVIGGGDFAADRIIPDCVRAIETKQDIVLRNPNSTRPYQHVLEPIFAYLLIAARQYSDLTLAGSYNVGPNESSCVSTEQLVETFCGCWNELTDGNLRWLCGENNGPHEATFLKLDCSKIKNCMGWTPKWNYERAIKETVAWTAVYLEKGDICEAMHSQIEEYLRESAVII